MVLLISFIMSLEVFQTYVKGAIALRINATALLLSVFLYFTVKPCKFLISLHTYLYIVIDTFI